MKGIAIITFNDNSKVNIDNQFPINLIEFLKLNSNSLEKLVKAHMQKKMEPNFIEIKIGNGLSIVSFYSGFSFRHYVGKPNFAISIFISESDVISKDFEGMMRRIAHELLPKKEALNFDDMLGHYYDLLKRKELAPYWEEIIEGETKIISVKRDEHVKKEFKEIIEGETKVPEENSNLNIKVDLLGKELDIKAKNVDLQDLLEEKKNKIRELTRKYTELVSENTKQSEDILSYKEELSDQYIKLERWSQQMADLNQNNAKLIDDIKILNQKINERDDFLKEKEKQIEIISKKLTSVEEFEYEAEKIIQEKEDLKNVNIGLNAELEKLEKANKSLINEIERLKSQITIHLDSITSLKLEVKNIKANILVKEKEKETFKEEMFNLKKEIKILRRERDHYRKIVKEKNLLE